jgi:hypothetical protein
MAKEVARGHGHRSCLGAPKCRTARICDGSTPYLPDGTASRSNAELVEVVVRMAENMGRPIASPETARKIIGLRR